MPARAASGQKLSFCTPAACAPSCARHSCLHFRLRTLPCLPGSPSEQAAFRSGVEKFYSAMDSLLENNSPVRLKRSVSSDAALDRAGSAFLACNRLSLSPHRMMLNGDFGSILIKGSPSESPLSPIQQPPAAGFIPEKPMENQQGSAHGQSIFMPKSNSPSLTTEPRTTERPTGEKLATKRGRLDSASSNVARAAQQDQQQFADTLPSILQEAAAEILFPFGVDKGLVLQGPQPFASRAKDVLVSKATRLRRAAWKQMVDLRDWVQEGGTLRILLVYTVLGLALIGATGLTAFFLVLLGCTANVLLLAFLLCLAAVGVFLGMFLISLSAIYVGALFVGAVVIGGFTISALVVATCVGGSLVIGYGMYKGAGMSIKCTRVLALAAAQAVATTAVKVEKHL